MYIYIYIYIYIYGFDVYIVPILIYMSIFLSIFKASSKEKNIFLFFFQLHGSLMQLITDIIKHWSSAV